MDSQKPDMNELISGLLDGHLSIEESKKLAEESSKNPEIERNVEILGALRSSLLRGRPTGKLGDRFAIRVVDQARSRAAMMGDEAPNWIDPTGATPIPSVFHPKELRRRWVMPVFSVLATCLIAFLFARISILYTESLERERQANIADFNRKQVEQDLLAVFGTERLEQGVVGGPSSSDRSSELSRDSSEVPSSSIVDAMLAEAARNLKESEIRGQDTDGSVGRDPDSANATDLASAPSKGSTSVEALVTVPDVAKTVVENKPSNSLSDMANAGVANRVAEEGPQENPIRLATARMMAVYEVTVDSAARDSDVLNIFLQKHGLGSVEDLVLDETQLNGVLKAGIVGPANSAGDAQVLVLKGTASMLSRFYADIEQSYEDFPKLRMNAVMDDSVGMIEEQMSSMRVTATAGVVGRLGASGPSGLVSSFHSGSAKFLDIPVEQRRLSKRREPGGELDPISYVMLVVRIAE